MAAEVGDNQQGWYTFKVSGADKPYKVETTFVQVGQAARMPWNFYYWPTKADAIHEPWAGGNGRVDTMQVVGDDILVATPGAYIAPGQDIVRAGPNGLLETRPPPGDDSTWFPNLYDDLTFRGADGTLYQTPSPLLKYDQLFRSSARSWEAGQQPEPGHPALAGPLPRRRGRLDPAERADPRPRLGHDPGRAEGPLGRTGREPLQPPHRRLRQRDPPRPAPPRLRRHATASSPASTRMLETHIRGRKQALLGNLRAFPPNGTNNEVWNHGVGKYTAKYHAVPGKGERTVRLEVELLGNSGSNLNNSDNKPRVVNYEYTLVYGLNGTGRRDERRRRATGSRSAARPSSPR